jgi:hypothetical protein
MLPQYATEQLIENIKRRCSVPTSQLTFEDADFVALANDELQGEVVPLIMSAREEYFVEHVDVTVPGDRAIDIPAQAVGAKLRSVVYLKQQNPLVMVNLPRIDLDVVAGIGFFNMYTFAGFYVEGNQLKLYPPNSVPTNSPLRLYYFSRSLVLTDPANYGIVESVDANTNTVILSSLPADWQAGDKLNAVSALPNFAVTAKELEIVAVSSPSVILDSVVGLNVGDYVSRLGFSAIPQVPVEAHAYLAQLTAVKCLEAIGDRPGMEVAQAKATKLKDNLLIMMSQRVDGSVKKLVNPSGGLRLSTSGWRRGWGW